MILLNFSILFQAASNSFRLRPRSDEGEIRPGLGVIVDYELAAEGAAIAIADGIPTSSDANAGKEKQ